MVGDTLPEVWDRIEPWRELFGVADNIFFYILRDVDFGGSHNFMKLDIRNIEFFDQNNLWRFGDEALGRTNKNARGILDLINECIKSIEPTWPYSPSHLNAAIYAQSNRRED